MRSKSLNQEKTKVLLVGVAPGSGDHPGEQEIGRNAAGTLAEAEGCWPPGLASGFNPFRYNDILFSVPIKWFSLFELPTLHLSTRVKRTGSMRKNNRERLSLKLMRQQRGFMTKGEFLWSWGPTLCRSLFYVFSLIFLHSPKHLRTWALLSLFNWWKLKPEKWYETENLGPTGKRPCRDSNTSSGSRVMVLPPLEQSIPTSMP